MRTSAAALSLLLGGVVVAAAVVTLVRWDRGVQLVLVAAAVVVLILGMIRRARSRRVRDWRDAELAVARWLRRAGCRRVALTTAGADGGVDVVTAHWAVQVKHTTKRVGRPAVQQIVGAALSLDRRAAVFSSSGFSAPAIDYAAVHDVALFELDAAGNARPLNRAARDVGKRRRLLR